ncbi:Inactive TPR repeat-containing thioredoxin TTL3 [Dendrobium catenatum]|uniref:Inactive TPR repeat-containing thioredoxin TTL3 n=2 Tax=Dendrobium catenatum TaxID=906689 RepID=A0A2I0WZW7_9ASPA|nr:Inactive TPR repeat-containing thioredoxin TTL3 [Dendrobium catenatum]
MGNEDKNSSSCGLLILYNAFFRRRAGSAPVSPRHPSPSPIVANASLSGGSSHSTKRRRPGPDQSPAAVTPKILVSPKPAAAACPPDQTNRPSAGRGVRPQTTSSISADLDSMIYDHQRAKGSNTLVRASSGNVMLYSNLGNLRAPGAVTPNRDVLDYLPKTAKEMESEVRRRSSSEYEAEIPVSMCRALSRRLDPEELKELGNEEYKNGRYAEAVAFYDRAIVIDPENASYWSNKAAALIGLGRLLEALQECRQAIRIDPCYLRAHQRLANLYLRLGEPERAANHYKLAKSEASHEDISRAKAVQVFIGKCSEARKQRDWNAVLKDSQSAISTGADSAPQVFAYQAEAFLMLLRQEDAEETMIDAPKFETDAATQFFGALSNAYHLSIRAQVDMATGRFESAVSLAQMAARIDPGSREIAAIARKARSVASARSMGNDLFKASNFEEACLAYGSGLNHDPHNTILLCNRAACRSKLGQWEKAIEDCNVVLNLRPKYSKARLRRADCNVKLDRWEDSIKDYEVLALEMPGDETVNKALQDAKAHVRRRQSEGLKQMADDSAVHITTKDQFRSVITSCGLSLALFYDQSDEDSKGILHHLEQLCKQHTSVTFLKDEEPESFTILHLVEEFDCVNMKEQASIVSSENVSSVPIFKLYKNGSNIEDVPGSDIEQLERTLQIFSRC